MIMTIEHNAARVIDFIDIHFGGSVLLMGGLSLGGQILLEILAQRKDICRYAFIESVLVVPSNDEHLLLSFWRKEVIYLPDQSNR